MTQLAVKSYQLNAGNAKLAWPQSQYKHFDSYDRHIKNILPYKKIFVLAAIAARFKYFSYEDKLWIVL